MTRYLLRRLLGAAPLVLGIVTVVFFVVSLAPGDAATHLIAPGMTREIADQIRSNFGLDQPIHVRYLRWLAAFATGDFGFSHSHGRPVADVIAAALPNTLLLSTCALVVAFTAGMVLGTLQAVKQHTPFDSGMSVLLLFFYSMPSFWLALMLVLVFSLLARNVWGWPIWFPASGMQSVDHDLLSGWGRLVDRARHLVLPCVSLSVVLAAAVARYMRSSVLEVVRQDFVRTARAKGLPERRVVFGHALRNALIPMATLVGLYLPVLFSGTVFIEYVFAWPGMGKTVVDAIGARDYPLIMGGSVIFATLVVVGNLAADVLYAVVDPRIRRE